MRVRDSQEEKVRKIIQEDKKIEVNEKKNGWIT